MKLLLAECKRMDGTLLPVDGLIGVWDPSASFPCVVPDAIVVSCEPFDSEDGTQISNLLVRPYFKGDDLETSLYEKKPVPVVAYWRRYGFPWSRRSVKAAQRFRIGLGGALMATLVPLLESVGRGEPPKSA